MKNKLLFVALSLLVVQLNAQIGVGTTAPNSYLDVRGSMALPFRSFTSGTAAAITDNTLVFTGTSAATLTLPDAASITGRYYWIKNESSNSSTLTISTTSAQTIDGLSTWTLTQQHKSLYLFSNGTGWYIATESTPGAATGSAWAYGGNSVPSQQNFGTTSNYSLPILTNNIERVRISNLGNVGIGTSSFNSTNPEKLLVEAGSTSSFNVISGRGSINSYLQLNIQNNNTGTSASSDLVATANNGDETNYFVNLGINGGGNTSTGVLGGANTGYLYNTGNDFAIGNASSGRYLSFFTGGTASTNERIRITGGGDVGIGITSPNYMLHMHKPSATSNWMQITNSTTGTGGYDGFFYGVTAAGQPQIWGEGDLAFYTGSGTTNNLTMTMKAAGNIGIGTTSFNATNPEKLVVDAGTTSSYNVISGKGSINNYLQLNIQNSSNGNAASSDVVATADNGNETVNFIDLGINSSTYTGSGILGGVNNAYLYATGNDFVIGNGTANKELVFFTGGTASTNEKMRVTGAAIQPGTDNATAMGTSAKRWSVVYAVNGTIQTSDIRLKKNILPLTYGLNEVMQMQPVSYDWKDNSGSHKIGLVAQAIKKIIPEVVVGDEEKENLGMNYAEIVPVLINAIKELKTELTDTKKQVEELKKLVNKQ